MVVKRVQQQRLKQQRKTAREALGHLANLIIEKRTALRYEAAVTAFFLWADRAYKVLDSAEATIEAAQAWVEECWNNGDSLSVAADTLSGLQHFISGFKGKLRFAWRLIGAWKRHELPKRAPPLLRVMVEAMANLHPFS